MSCRIFFNTLNTLPRFAWAAEIVPSKDTMTVHHGSGIEKSPDGKAIVEGAWNGNFEDFTFHDASVFSGTGFRSEGERLVFCSSTDRLSPIFSLKANEGIHYLSNSAIFLMSLAGKQPHPNYPFYNRELLRYWRMGDHAQYGSIKLEGGCSMLMHMRTKVVYHHGGDIEYQLFREDSEPRDYDHYFNILSEATKAALDNARDPKRKTPLDTAAALSKGYDSAAAAGLARDAGCKKTYTLLNSRLKDPHEDSGKDHATALGMQCLEFDRWEYHQFERPVEPEFCLVSSASNIPISSMEAHLKDHIYVTAPSGECAWDPKHQGAFQNFSSPWVKICSGLSQLEFRLRVGYIVFAPPAIALTHSKALTRIVRSQEMGKWHIEGDYNRPIARRIAETGGIPTHKLGRTKHGGGHASLDRELGYSHLGHESYLEFFKPNKKNNSLVIRCYWHLRFSFTYFLYYKVLNRKRHYTPSTPLMRRFPFLLNAAPRPLTWQYAFTFQWAFHSLKNRYTLTSLDKDS